MYCLDIWWKLEGLEGLTTSSPSHSASVHKGPWAKQPSLSNEPGTVPAYPWAASFSSLPVCGILQTSQGHLPTAIRRHLTLLVLPKPATHSPWFFTLFLSTIPIRPCVTRPCPFLSGCGHVYIFLSSSWCWLSYGPHPPCVFLSLGRLVQASS